MKFSGNDRRALALCGAAIAWALALAGCQASADATAPQVPAPAIQPAADGTAAREIGELLDQAAAAAGEEHYIYPARGSAMSLYHRVLVLDPANPNAQRGLEQLVDRFLAAATLAMERRQYLLADTMLGRARLVDGSNLNIEPLGAQLRLLEGAQREKVTLDWRKVAARSSELSAPLARIGAAAKGAGCRATITVSNDEEGRWVYQQMSRSPGDTRIRAEVRIASPASVEVLCF